MNVQSYHGPFSPILATLRCETLWYQSQSHYGVSPQNYSLSCDVANMTSLLGDIIALMMLCSGITVRVEILTRLPEHSLPPSSGLQVGSGNPNFIPDFT